MSQVDKIAREVLTGVDGDFDLANYDGATCTALVQARAAAPVPSVIPTH